MQAGRKRNPETRTAILDAALALLRDDGYTALTVDRIAAAAGCGKQTIYRWWPSKAEVVLEAVAEHAHALVTAAPTDDARADLHGFLRRTIRGLRGPNSNAPILRALMAEAQLDPEFRGALRASFIDRRRAALVAIVRRVARGLDDDGVAVLVDAIYGAIWYRMLLDHAPLGDAFADQLAELALRAAR